MHQEKETVIDKSLQKSNNTTEFIRDESHRQEINEANIETWVEPLGEYTFETHFVPLEKEDAIALKLNYHNDSGEPSDIPDFMPPDVITQRISALKKAVQAKIDQIIEETKRDNIPGQAQDGVFVKMSSRSAKDSTLFSEDLIDHYIDYIISNKSQDLNSKVQALLYASTKLLKISSADAAFQFFTKSERITKDITEYLLYPEEEFNMNIVIRRWTDIDIDMEFRGFYNNGKLTALCQYNYVVVFKRLLDDGRKETIQKQIFEFFESKIKDKLDAAGFQRYIIDFAITGDNYDKIYVIELNPFVNSTDSALFSWKLDSAILENGPFEFRLTTEEDPNLLSKLDVESQQIIRSVQVPYL